jgi:hypothetical protein
MFGSWFEEHAETMKRTPNRHASLGGVTPYRLAGKLARLYQDLRQLKGQNLGIVIDRRANGMARRAEIVHGAQRNEGAMRFMSPRPVRRLIAGTLAAGVLLMMGSAEAKTLKAGFLTFSDERGGFEIVSVTGIGLADDPIILTERIFGAEPVTLVIRADPVTADDGGLAIGGHFAIAMVKVVINDTPTSWTGFSLELQEVPGKPSGYFDGLSFDQITQFRERLATSDRFADIGVEQEPRDRINFHSGSVTRHDRAELVFNITDLTPRTEFFMVQDPEVATAGIPGMRWAGGYGR